MNVKLVILSIALFSQISVFANSVVDEKDGIRLGDDDFPWQLVVDRGKILGCVYDSKFYSLGSVLILESLPRKCEQASDRNGIWQILSEQEMQDFKRSMEEQKETETQQTIVRGQPITDEEARLIMYLRHSKKMAARKNKK